MHKHKNRNSYPFFLEHDILVDRNMLQQLDDLPEIEKFYSLVQTSAENGTVEFNNDGMLQLMQQFRQRQNSVRSEQKQTPRSSIQPDPSVRQASVKVISSYTKEPCKREVRHFVDYFKSRYHALKKILMNRKELINPTSISRILMKNEKTEVAIIGIISHKHISKKENIILTLEDPTATIKVIINKNKPDVWALAKDCVLDEVLGVSGMLGGNVIFGNKLFLPDVPIYKELKKSPDEAYMVCIGDTHFGHQLWMKEGFEKFISWLCGEYGTESQKEVASKVRYLFIAGDLVEGVGIYPEQDKELAIKDIYEQYDLFAHYLSLLPDHIQVICCPGNHDAMRLAEPQPPLYEEYAKKIVNLPNVTCVSNPGWVNIHASEDFAGFDILLYHGFSYVYYSENVESIRAAGGQTRCDLIMKFLLQRRHLAPSHKSTLYLPDPEKDSLVIESVPDFLVSGHIHRCTATTYRNVCLLNCSCWLGKTEFQEKLGLHPQPGRVITINLQTRKMKILKFVDDDME